MAERSHQSSKPPAPEECIARARRMLNAVDKTHDENGLIDGMAYGPLHVVVRNDGGAVVLINTTSSR